MLKKQKVDEIKPENLVTTRREIPNPYDGKRIYVVVAESILQPLNSIEEKPNELFTEGYPALKRSAETRLISQLPGRMAAQAAHAVSKVRHFMLREEVLRANRIAQKTKTKKLLWFKSDMLFFFPITTIILSCRNNLELKHVENLLRYKTNVDIQVFGDTNPEVYGTEKKVLTALATHPVTPEQVNGILDYLPLFTP